MCNFHATGKQIDEFSNETEINILALYMEGFVGLPQMGWYDHPQVS